MGGRALNNYGIVTERKSSEDFFRIGNTISEKVSSNLNIETEIVKSYHNKSTHGDLDLLLKIDHQFHNSGANLKDYIRNNFNPNAIHNGGGVYSFDYENFQIDFIPVKESNWETARVYFSYDPLGNAMGKTFHKLNLSYGWDGLKYKYRNFNGVNSQDILLSKTPQEIFEFGGFDYNRYLMGFDNIEEIFRFIMNSKYFNPDIFKMENLKHIDKKRNRKRKSYHEFLKYVENKGVTNKYEFNKDKSVYLPMIEKAFPQVNFMEQLKKLDEKNEINRQLNEKFNGKTIMSWYPDLKGKELGNMITEFKKHLGDNYNDFILNNNIEVIKNEFANFYGREKERS